MRKEGLKEERKKKIKKKDVTSNDFNPKLLSIEYDRIFQSHSNISSLVYFSFISSSLALMKNINSSLFNLEILNFLRKMNLPFSWETRK